MASTIIRPFEAADLPGAASALVEVHATDGYPVEGVDQPERWLQSADTLAAWVAESNGKIVGHVAVMLPHGEDAVSMWIEQSGDSEGRIGVLARLFVLPETRGRSIGERLVRTATDYARGQGRRLVGDVMAKDEAAIRLYKRLGCQIIGITMHSYGDGAQTPALCFVAPGP